MCKIQEDRELTDRVMRHIGERDDARALVRLLSYAAEEAINMRADLAHSLIRASIEAIELEISGSPSTESRQLRLT